MADFLVPGYDVGELLGFGSGGDVWSGREQATGLPVALKRLHADADLAARDRLRREAAVLAGIDHPHVLRLRSVVGAGESLVLVLDLATGGSLARLLATCGRLTPGEVVTIAVPLAQALATIHAQGLVHGDVTPANVLFTADGRPVLSDLGVSRLLGAPHSDVGGTPGFLDPAVLAGGEAGPAADVHGLAATCFAALAGHPAYDEHGRRVPLPEGNASLGTALEAALAPDPATRPAPGELAAAVYDAAAAEPVRLTIGTQDRVAWVGPSVPAVTRGVARVTAGPPVEPSRAGRRHPLRTAGAHRAGAQRASVADRRRTGSRLAPSVLQRRTVLVLLVGVGVLSAALRTGLLWEGGSGRASPAAVRPAQERAAPVDWVSVLQRLDRTRSLAFAEGDPGRLAGVYASGSPALARDRAVLEQLLATGHSARGVELVPTSVEVVRSSVREAVLRVVDVMSGYDLVSSDGVVSTSRPGRASTRWSIRLLREGAAWRVLDVRRS